MEQLLTVALIIAITSLLKKQFGLTGWVVLVTAFVISLVIGFAPLIASALPALAPWITQLISVFVMWMAAAGSVDFSVMLRTTTKAPTPGL